MTNQLVIHRRDLDDGDQGLSWLRIMGIAMAITLHLVALLLLLIVGSEPKRPPEKPPVTEVTLISKPLPPPPPPPVQELTKPIQPPKEQPTPPKPTPPPIKQVPRQRPKPNPRPIIDVPQPRQNDVTVPPAPPAPPAPASAPADSVASVDIGSRQMNKPEYPATAKRLGIQGEVVLIIDVDAEGNVTNVTVERSSRNRDLDNSAMQAARKWKFYPAIVHGQKTPGRVRVPVSFTL